MSTLFWCWLIWYVTSRYYGRQVLYHPDGTPYLYRYFIYKPDWLDRIGINSKKAGRIYLHKFVSSDHDRALHDHPWNFVSIILYRGYKEHVDGRQLTTRHFEEEEMQWIGRTLSSPYEYVMRIRPGRIVRRGAGWRHRVELLTDELGNELPSWSFLFIGPKVRQWGFWTAINRWCHWKKYDAGNGICEEPEKEF
jgi:hypothetical protein